MRSNASLVAFRSVALSENVFKTFVTPCMLSHENPMLCLLSCAFCESEVYLEYNL